MVRYQLYGHVYCLIPRGPASWDVAAVVPGNAPYGFQAADTPTPTLDAVRHGPLTIREHQHRGVTCVDQHDVRPDYEMHASSSSESNSDSDQLAPLKVRESEHGHSAPPPHDLSLIHI